MKIYISGPITGRRPDKVREAFEAAAEAIRAKGHEPVNPVMSQEILDPKTTTWDQYMKLSLVLVEISDGICMLNGWRTSTGATLELAHAINHRKYVFYGTKEIWAPVPDHERKGAAEDGQQP